MPATTPVLLESLPYQTEAAEAVVRALEGNSRPATPERVGNCCHLSWAELARQIKALGFPTTVHKRLIQMQPRRVFTAPRDTFGRFRQADLDPMEMG